jgi:amino-acid N-acetyltransferase
MNIRKATFKDVKKIHKLINSFARKEKVLPRSLNYIYENLRDFWIAEEKEIFMGCIALHIVWENLAEIKSLCIKKEAQGKGIGKKLIKKVLMEAKKLEIKKIFILTYFPNYFKKFGFSLIEKSKLPNKIWSECINCPKFPDCEEEAMIKKVGGRG